MRSGAEQEVYRRSRDPVRPAFVADPGSLFVIRNVQCRLVECPQVVAYLLERGVLVGPQSDLDDLLLGMRHAGTEPFLRRPLPPGPRYGDAKKGNCQGQVRVNDALANQ